MLPRNIFFPRPGPALRGIFANARPSLRPPSISAGQKPRTHRRAVDTAIRDDHAAYIASWLKVSKDDKRAIFTVASHAQKAADYLHGLQPQEAQS
jgi:Zincin-like metallopeptidase